MRVLVGALRRVERLRVATEPVEEQGERPSEYEQPVPALGRALLGEFERWLFVLGIGLLVVGIVSSLVRKKGGAVGGGNKMWRGERVTYGNPYGENFLRRIRRMFGGR